MKAASCSAARATREVHAAGEGDKRDKRDEPSVSLAPPCPLPPHDPRERSVVLHLGAWEVRTFAGRFLEYFAPRGFLHVQYWHADLGISILSPSRLTGARYEVSGTNMCKMHFLSWGEVRAYVQGACDVDVPSEIEAFQTETVLVEQLRDGMERLSS